MNRISKLFQEKKENVLSVYFTAGYPDLNDTKKIINTLTETGVDLIEIGIPFSDPLADGPTIQKSGEKALGNGMTLKVLFQQLKEIRKESDIPLIMMGYLNPVLRYGIEDFCKDCENVGIDGLILPDLPLAEYEETYKPLFDKHGLYNIFLITPQTSEARIKQIDEISTGFIYMVSSSSTTGAKDDIASEQENYFKRIASMKLKNPKLIGVGISDNKTFRKACEYSSGAIIGSAFIKALANEGALENNINSFVKEIIN